MNRQNDSGQFALVNIKTFLGINDKSGNQTIYGGIREIYRQSNLVNNEVLGNVLNRKRVEIDETFPYEYQYIPKIKLADNSKILSSKDLIRMEKVNITFGTDFLETGYGIDVWTVRTMKEWGAALSNFERNMYISKNDLDNLITLDKVINYALATGRYKLLPHIDPGTDAPITDYEKADNDRYQDITNILNTIKAISIKKTDVSYGQSKERSQLIVSPYVETEFMRASKFISASNASFEVFKSGKLGHFGGVPYNTSIYLDRLDKKEEANNGYKDFDFRDVLGLIFDIDSVQTITKPWVNMGPQDGNEAGWMYNIAEKNILSRQVQWKTMAIVAPAREHLNWIFLRKAPDLARVNAARAALKAEQPVFYSSFEDLLPEDLNKLNEYAKNPRLIGGADTPQDGIPALLRVGAVATEVKAKAKEGK
ncbi:MAG: hypothetical protein ACRCUM_00075 [Mycoplasmoidaceae bacterium]